MSQMAAGEGAQAIISLKMQYIALYCKCKFTTNARNTSQQNLKFHSCTPFTWHHGKYLIIMTRVKLARIENPSHLCSDQYSYLLSVQYTCNKHNEISRQNYSSYTCIVHIVKLLASARSIAGSTHCVSSYQPAMYTQQMMRQ